MIRAAVPGDIDRLVEIENKSFKTDRLTRRNLRHLLTRANAVTLVDTRRGVGVRGFIAVLFHRGTSLARLYTIAVDPGQRGQGVAKALLRAAEAAARDRGAAYMRLEVHFRNKAARRLYERSGYKPFGIYIRYYEDSADAVRMEKRLVTRLRPPHSPVPYYPQSLEFTCGPACLLMAMRALDRRAAMNRAIELRIWRESTMIFMTSGHGGCSPYGLALSAYRRGFAVEVFASGAEPMFVDSVRSESKKEVMRLVERDFVDELKANGIRVRRRPPKLLELETAFDEGAIPIVLISTYRFDRQRTPHWIVITGFDERYVYIHEPYVDYEEEKSATDCSHMPVPRDDFHRIARYGRDQQKAVILVRKGDA